ncbi:hypothetical protein GGX14DRAFT_607058 [Mycena pura]|uniref:Uncharacterized protein n=1 Tax=Mycena pura TaxID=153505 RepID=A0AAD6VL07_9AGAR|nr:hypothetical protein GGX14DRAFT_607058 [Mycena pura]
MNSPRAPLPREPRPAGGRPNGTHTTRARRRPSFGVSSAGTGDCAPDETKGAQGWHFRAVQDGYLGGEAGLENCSFVLPAPTCSQGWHFRAVQDGYLGGEGIWARSTVRPALALTPVALPHPAHAQTSESQYTYLYTDDGLDPMVCLYRVFAPLVPSTRLTHICTCFRDPYCPLRAWGIPIWKILSFHYWDYADHPLGRKWTLSPEPYLPRPRQHLPGLQRAALLHRARRRLRCGRAVQEADAALPAGVANLGGTGPTQFYEAVARLWVLRANAVRRAPPRRTLHQPATPSAQWDSAHPDDRSKWEAQHEALKQLGRPHVYNVFKDDEDERF